MHICPGPDCSRQVPYDMLMCASHWYKVPKPLRNRVYAAWREGEGAGSPEHTRAVDDAIVSLQPTMTADELAQRRAEKGL